MGPPRAALSLGLALAVLASADRPQCQPVCDALAADYERKGSLRPVPPEDAADHQLRMSIDTTLKMVTVSVHGNGGNFHPMSGTAEAPPLDPVATHFIEAMWVVNQVGDVVAVAAMNPFSHSRATFSFLLREGSTSLTAHAYCSVHGWFTSTEEFSTNSIVQPLPAEPCKVSCDTNALAGDSILALHKRPAFSPPTGAAAPPSPWDAMKPLFSANGAVTKVSLSLDASHGLNASADVEHVHFVTGIFIVDETDAVVAYELFAPAGTPPSLEVTLPPSVTGNIYAYAHSSRHGLFKSDPFASYSTSAGAATLRQCFKECRVPTPPVRNDYYQTCVPTSALAAHSRHRQRATYGRTQPFPGPNLVMTVAGDRALVTVGTPLDPATGAPGTDPVPFPTERDVTIIFAEDQNGLVLAAGRLDTQSAPPMLLFPVPENTTAITPYYLNTSGALHHGRRKALSDGVIEVDNRVCRLSREGGYRADESPICNDGRGVLQAPPDTPVDTTGWATDLPFLTLHTPVLTNLGGGSVRVHVGDSALGLHPHVRGKAESTDPDAVHFIDEIWVEDARGAVVARAALSPETPPSVMLRVPQGTTDLTPHALCSQHGVFKGSTVDVSVNTAVPTGREKAPTLDLCHVLVSKVEQLAQSIKDERNLTTFEQNEHRPQLSYIPTERMVRVVVNFEPNVEETAVHYVHLLWVEALSMENGSETWHDVAMWIPSPDEGDEDGFAVNMTVPQWAEAVRAKSHCNRHGIWTSAEMRSESNWRVSGTRSSEDICRIRSCFPSTSTDACDAYRGELQRADVVLHAVGKNKSYADTEFVPGTADAGIKLDLSVKDFATPAGTTRRALARGVHFSENIRDREITGSPIRNTGAVSNSPSYLESMFIEDQDRNVIALGIFSPYETFSTLDIEVPPHATKLRTAAFVPDFGLIWGEEVDVTFPDSPNPNAGGASKTCVVAKCVAQICTQPYDVAIDQEKMYSVSKQPRATDPPVAEGDAASWVPLVVGLSVAGLCFIAACYYCCCRRTEFVPLQEIDFNMQSMMHESELGRSP